MFLIVSKFVLVFQIYGIDAASGAAVSILKIFPGDHVLLPVIDLFFLWLFIVNWSGISLIYPSQCKRSRRLDKVSINFRMQYMFKSQSTVECNTCFPSWRAHSNIKSYTKYLMGFISVIMFITLRLLVWTLLKTICMYSSSSYDWKILRSWIVDFRIDLV